MRTWAVGNEAPEPRAVARNEAVRVLDDAVRKGVKETAGRPGAAHRAQKYDASSPALDERPVREHQAPRRHARVIGYPFEQVRHSFVLQRQECEALFAVELGDDPRRPAAEPSARVVEENGAVELHQVLVREVVLGG
jgi:hypothetical protein